MVVSTTYVKDQYVMFRPEPWSTPVFMYCWMLSETWMQDSTHWTQYHKIHDTIMLAGCHNRCLAMMPEQACFYLSDAFTDGHVARRNQDVDGLALPFGCSLLQSLRHGGSEEQHLKRHQPHQISNSQLHNRLCGGWYAQSMCDSCSSSNIWATQMSRVFLLQCFQRQLVLPQLHMSACTAAASCGWSTGTLCAV